MFNRCCIVVPHGIRELWASLCKKLTNYINTYKNPNERVKGRTSSTIYIDEFYYIISLVSTLNSL